MIIYLIILLIAGAIYMSSINLPNICRNKTLLACCLGVLAIFIGLADMQGGYDRYIYSELFDGMANLSMHGMSPFEYDFFDFYEPGYQSYVALMSMITYNRYIFIFITTCLIYALIYQSFKSYVVNYPLGILLFMGLWMFFTYTYLRQVIGVTIAWYSLRYVTQRNWFRFYLFLLIAFLFHHSALILAPVYFLPLKKYSVKRVQIVMFMLFLIGLTPWPTALFTIYGEVDQDRKNFESYIESGSSRFDYIIEAVLFLYFIIKSYRFIPDKPKNVMLLNVALGFCGILLFFSRSINGGRLGWYYLIGVIATLSYIGTYGKEHINKGLMFSAISALLYIRIVYSWGGMLRPYKTFLSPGHNQSDMVYEKYEYDDGYDVDKMYRPALWFLKE